MASAGPPSIQRTPPHWINASPTQATFWDNLRPQPKTLLVVVGGVK